MVCTTVPFRMSNNWQKTIIISHVLISHDCDIGQDMHYTSHCVMHKNSITVYVYQICNDWLLVCHCALVRQWYQA